MVKRIFGKRPILDIWRRSDAFIVKFEHISHLLPIFLLLTFKKELLAGNVPKVIFNGLLMIFMTVVLSNF